MSIGILGTKIGMTQIFDDKGLTIPATILQVGPCTITQIKREIDSNHANIQIGYKYIRPDKINKPLQGHLKKNNLPCFKHLKEYKTDKYNELNIGEIIDISKINTNKHVNISGVSIGKGFSGCQKRHHFSRGPMSHGSKNHRAPGSIGAGTTPGRVFPGKKMAGRMGNKQVTTKNLAILNINTQNNILTIKGCVPGKKGNLLYIYQK
uniref:Large ribosomal subunit protein uL3c n=1 Tax=Herposiphonia versicolor TaxID=2007163 RepID=A0A1Z1MFE1_9FLOR|nr:ribosomal protein L3 [Herposiphonia versicolor]ARW64808.1 ribosomal protein L3 [Herposiphonia versicolor]